MSGKLHRINDLVTYNLGYINGISTNAYCRIVDIIDSVNISHIEYNIITGRGKENSIVSIHLKPITYTEDLSELNTLDSTIKIANPHDIFLIDVGYEIENILKEIELCENRLNFLKTNRNRNDKIDDLIE